MRLGVFGGSFDPVHFGHLLLAEHCREACRLDRVLFVPAATPPHKASGLRASSKDRVEMLRLAIAGHQYFEVCNVEVERGGLSYTADTLADLRRQHADAELFFLMGAESLAELPAWRQPARICELATIVVARRAGAPEVDFGVLNEIASPKRLDQFRAAQFETPIIELSSTDIRRRVADGASIRFRTPRAVEKYIETGKLYQSP